MTDLYHGEAKTWSPQASAVIFDQVIITSNSLCDNSGWLFMISYRGDQMLAGDMGDVFDHELKFGSCYGILLTAPPNVSRSVRYHSG